MALTENSVTFCLLSFEGPDPYAQAGGLGVRITHLAETLARLGFNTHLFFVGDPNLPGHETSYDGRLVLHRWCQWISAYHPGGVYAGEEDKLRDFNSSLPPYLIENIIRPALAAGQLPVILAEEWHTAEALNSLHDQLEEAGMRQRCVLFWNANNTMSFHRIDWPRLDAAVQLTTVSRYMKHLMWKMGLNPLVIPNGIPTELLMPVDRIQISELQEALNPDKRTVMLFKVGRFDPAKRWMMAVEAAADLKAAGQRVVFPLRGGVEEHGFEVLGRASELGLIITDVNGQPNSWNEVVELLKQAPEADIYNLRFFMSQEMLRPFYATADAVLANSGHEPFGLVGLEAMAAGGVVFTGATGEEYTLCGECAVVLDTDSPNEIVSHVLELKSNPARIDTMRRTAPTRAAAFSWDQISNILLDKIRFIARSTGAMPQIPLTLNEFAPGEHVGEFPTYPVFPQPQRNRVRVEALAASAD
jgi:glycosyltransferase involved in cell wall biosynthesis